MRRQEPRGEPENEKAVLAPGGLLWERWDKRGEDWSRTGDPGAGGRWSPEFLVEGILLVPLFFTF